MTNLINDTSPSHEKLIEVLGRQPEVDEPRLAYNLACYYTTISDYSRAIRALAVAAVEPAVRAWAFNDPSLARLRQQSEWESLFPKPPVEA